MSRTFLQLCQKTARESGIVSGTQPASVVDQTGDLLKIVEFVKDSWRQIQTARNGWLWMRKEFSKGTIIGTTRYTPASWNLTDVAEWVRPTPSDPRPVTLYLTATGVADEGEIAFLEWPLFVSRYLRGSQTNGRPVAWSISPAGEFCLGPAPDVAYTVRGLYRQSAQEFSANGDIPGMPGEHHDLIAYEALMKLAGHEEATFSLAVAQRERDRMMTALMRDQLPRVSLGGGPLA